MMCSAGSLIANAAALVLRFYEGRTEVEIAEILRCQPGTVGPLISHGLDAVPARAVDHGRNAMTRRVR